MVMVENASELDFILPASLEPLDYAELFEQAYGAIDTGAVDAVASGDQLVHTHGFLVLQGIEHTLAAGGQAVALRAQRGFKGRIGMHKLQS